MSIEKRELEQSAHLDEQTHAHILEAAEETYEALSERYLRSIDVVHKIGLCVPASELMEDKLGDKSYSLKQITSTKPVYHRYVALPSENTGENVFADITWQQFLIGEPAPDAPKVIVGTAEEVTEAVRMYGLISRFLDLYRPHCMSSDEVAVAHI